MKKLIALMLLFASICNYGMQESAGGSSGAQQAERGCKLTDLTLEERVKTNALKDLLREAVDFRYIRRKGRYSRDAFCYQNPVYADQDDTQTYKFLRAILTLVDTQDDDAKFIIEFGKVSDAKKVGVAIDREDALFLMKKLHMIGIDCNSELSTEISHVHDDSDGDDD